MDRDLVLVVDNLAINRVDAPVHQGLEERAPVREITVTEIVVKTRTQSRVAIQRLNLVRSLDQVAMIMPCYTSNHQPHRSLPRRPIFPPPLPPPTSSLAPLPPSYLGASASPYRTRGFRPYIPQPQGSSFKPPIGSFDFRVDKPSGIKDVPESSYSNWRANPGRNLRERRNNPSHPAGNPDYKSSRRLVPPSERPILKVRSDSGPEILLGVEPNVKMTVYRSVDNLSDDEEAPMDLSDSMSSQVSATAQESSQGKKKRPRLMRLPDVDAEVPPKWCNPDPYTALSPADQSKRKRRDVVKLIRKARVGDDDRDKNAPSAEAEDFISFVDLDRERGPPTGPKSLKESKIGQMLQGAYLTPHSAPFNSAIKPDTSKTANDTKPSGKAAQDVTAVLERPDPCTDPLGTRKRTIDDELKPPNLSDWRLKKLDRNQATGAILPAWLPVDGEERYPWKLDAHSCTVTVALK